MDQKDVETLREQRDSLKEQADILDEATEAIESVIYHRRKVREKEAAYRERLKRLNNM